MAFLGLLEGQWNLPKPHAGLVSEIMVITTSGLVTSLTKTPDKDLRCCLAALALKPAKPRLGYRRLLLLIAALRLIHLVMQP